jgi:hypothetical protein
MGRRHWRYLLFDRYENRFANTELPQLIALAVMLHRDGDALTTTMRCCKALLSIHHSRPEQYLKTLYAALVDQRLLIESREDESPNT